MYLQNPNDHKTWFAYKEDNPSDSSKIVDGDENLLLYANVPKMIY